MNGKRKISTLAAAFAVLAAISICPALQAAEGDAVLGGCVKEVSGLQPNQGCTANDVALTDIVPGSLEILDDGCTSVTDTVTFTIRGIFALSTNERYDIGVFIASDTDTDLNGAYAGACYRDSLPNVSPIADLDGDGCGDINTPTLEQPVGTVLGPFTVPCIDRDGDGKADILHCETWDQPGADFVCTGPDDVFAGTSSKCNCGSLPSACIAVPDNDACTTDVCAGTCSGGTNDGTVCENNSDCTGEGTCQNIHLQHIPIVCNDGNACTTDSCDPATGCTTTPVNCNDSNACTTDGCAPATGCTHTAVDCNDSNACTTDGCAPATGCTHTAVDCNDSNACTTDGCAPATGCTHTAVVCSDGDLCTTDSCVPATGCVYTAVVCADPECEACDPATGSCVAICEEAICRTPGFYGTHAGIDPKKKDSQNITQALIDAAISINVCGLTLDNTDVDNVHSALEAICVSPRGDPVLQLVRQLTTLALNCIVSGGGADCDGLEQADLFADCDLACQDLEATRTVEQCIGEVDCFNNGGQWIDGACYLGNCSNDQTLCYSSADCVELGVPYDCVPFPGNCHDKELCFDPEQEILCFEPPGPAGSSKACNDATTNNCTVFGGCTN